MCGNELASISENKKHASYVYTQKEDSNVNRYIQKRLRYLFLIPALVTVRLLIHERDVADAAIILGIFALSITLFVIVSHKRHLEDVRIRSDSATSSSNRENLPIISFLNRSNVRMESNWWKKMNSTPPGRFARIIGKKGSTIGFSTENENVTLTMTMDGKVRVGNESQLKHDFDIHGPEDHMLIMLQNAKHIHSIPSSMRITMRGKEVQPEVEVFAAQAIATTLRVLFE